ncbi:MAG: hypothetical protein JAY67_19475, partial [Candidatus Thiodiazotropha taylori]|nr:hypothetical protein [Candidatus Thiodiazotropha taylori]
DGAKKLACFHQAPIKEEQAWRAPDIDWAAGSWMPLVRGPAPLVAFESRNAAEITDRVKRLLSGVREQTPLLPVTPVEQVHCEPVDDQPGVAERPMWLRSLLALRSFRDAWKHKPSEPWEQRITLLVSSGRADGRVARFKLVTRQNQPLTPGASLSPAIRYAGHLVAIDRATTVLTELPFSERDAGAGGATARARSVARAEHLVREPVALRVIENSLNTKSTAKQIWSAIEIPLDLDDGSLDIPLEIEPSQRLYASPALGWPTSSGTYDAASGALGLDEDSPFQDLGQEQEKTATVKDYGSGFAGRAARLALPARAESSEAVPCNKKTAKIDAAAPAFIVLGRKTIFERPSSDRLPITAPPARHLSPTDARARVPNEAALREALCSVVEGQAAPLVPPYLSRLSFGLRPGTMHAEFDAMLFATNGRGKMPIDRDVARFGRPGHAGPRLVRQQRSPRSPAFPRVPKDFVKSHGRRTFVEVDDLLDGKQIARPFVFFEGVATVLRRGDKSFQIRFASEIDPDWDGAVILKVSSPSHKKDPVSLRKDLIGLGLLREGVSASFSIDRHSACFTKMKIESESDSLKLTFSGVDPVPFRTRIDAADGDTEVILNVRCAKEAKGATKETGDAEDIEEKAATASDSITLQCGKKSSEALVPESRRQFALRLPLRTDARPSLPVTLHTLVFADPAYDRALSGPGAADQRRDKDGQLWKFALDRFVYGTDTPIYFAFGPIGKEGGFEEHEDREVELRLKWQKATKDAKLIDLSVEGIKDTIQIHLAPDAFYALTLDQLRYENNQDSPIEFGDGDQIQMTVSSLSEDLTFPELTVRAEIVRRPIIAPPPAVYGLVVPEGKTKASVLLYATGPLPQRIEFPNLMDDLAGGHIQRRALFQWTSASALGTAFENAALVKIDRAGGGQLPNGVDDLIEVETLKK